jgi:hypothetical protein
VIVRTRIGLAALCSAAVAATAVALTAPDEGSGAREPKYLVVSALPGVGLADLEQLPGLGATSGPFPSVGTEVRLGGRSAGVTLEGRDVRRSAVGQPPLASGSWTGAGTVVLDKRVAHAIGAHVGAPVTVATADGPAVLRLSGTTVGIRGVSPAAARGYVTEHALRRVAPNRRTWSWTLNLRLAEPHALARYASWLRERFPARQAAVAVRSESG